MPSSSEEEFLDGVAVVGLAGRFPGAASVAELWENLKAGRESVVTFSDEELAASGIPEHLIRDPSYVRARGLLDDPEMFDAGFFGISPREAELMDPQHRLFLETCWHALENAGYAPASVDARVGVWGGMSTGMSNDTYLHSNLGGPRGVPEEDVLSAMLGNENDYLTTRVSYKLNLRGPSVNVQTACSTSLMAVVQAFQSLVTYGCDMALAGGVSVSYPQKAGYLHQEGGIGSPDGHCRPFDAEAQGTVFSNGVGVAVLKRLEEALEDGDPILAVIRGAASNNDGSAKMSFAAPSVEGQAEVIATALAVADVDPSSVTYVETHGTGTPIGDPIEVEGLTRAFRRGTDETGFCALGSIKSNFGHLDSAAGIAGFIKAVLSLHHRTLVPTVHFRTPSPRIDWEGSPFFVNAETRAWETDRLPRRAGVSAFGIGGTNAHVVLEEAPVRPSLEPATGPEILPLSARTEEALRDAMDALAGHLADHPDLRLADVAHTLQRGRETFRERAALVADTTAEVRDILEARDRSRLVTARAQSIDGCVFLFPGGGAQYVAMGRDLYDTLPDFRADVDRGLALLEEREGLDLRSVWFSRATAEAQEAFQRPSVQLPAIFILEVALARQLMRWGFEPTALIGHSMGENTAACLAGVLEYGDALGLVALRGRLFDSAAPGGMLSVTASREALEPSLGSGLDLAAVNGPEQCTVSGPQEAIDRLAVELEDAGIDARIVPIDIAAHSSLVDPLLEPFERYLRSVALKPPAIPFLSNRTGTWITDAEATDPAYWAAHLRATVRFGDNVRTVLEQGRPFFLVVGPGRILSSLVKLADPAVAPRVSATLRHPSEEMEDTQALLTAVARFWVAGGEVDWERLRGESPVRRVALPGYPFQRRRFLVEPPTGASALESSGTAGADPRTSGPAASPAEGATSSSSGQPGTEAPTAAAGAGVGRDGLRRVMELQIQTNAAIQNLLTGMLASRAGEGAASGSPTVPVRPEPPAARQEAAESETPSPASPSVAPTKEEAGPSPEARRAFWERRLEGPLPVLDLMTDQLRAPGRLSERAGVEAHVLPSTLAGAHRLGTEEGVGPGPVLLAAYAAVLHLETGQPEFMVGIPAPGQEPADASLLPLRLRVEPGAPFRRLVRAVGQAWEDAVAHRGLELRELLALAGVPEDPTRAPLVQTRFAWSDQDAPSRPDGSTGPVASRSDLELFVELASAGGRARVDYAAALFGGPTMEDLLSHWTEVLRVGTDDPDQPVDALPVAAPGVMDRLASWNDSAVPRPEVESLAGWLTEGWHDRRERLALVAGDQRLTYGELEERSDRLAQHLVASGVTPGSLVGLCLERTAELVVATVAAWKAGAGYVPLDPTYPPARLELMARRANLALLVSVESLADRVAGYDGPHVLLDRDREAIDARPAAAPEVLHDLSHPAYILFTSGSTGEPKGVQVPGRCVINLLESTARRPGLEASDVLLAVTTLSFDISVLEFFLPLRIGARLVLATSQQAMDGPALVRLLEEHEVTLLQSTPSTYRLLLSAGWKGRPGLRVICAGEPVPRDLLRALLPRVAEVWNGYGPTEATVYASFARLTDADAPIVIGTPVENTRCHVLDAAGRQVPPGVAGELYIAGLGVADGYVGRPEETARRFLPDPFGPPGARMYRTGDAVRWRRNGALEHLNRMDQQVKVRGFRVELGEVEATLASCQGVDAAAVVLREMEGGPELAGYVAAQADAWTERALRDRIGERLPSYMVPRFLVRLDALPLTENGKVDRKALPDPRDGSGWAPVESPPAPVSEAESYLSRVWEEILEVPDIRADDNFFDLGGHSLLAVRAIARVREDRGVDIPLRALMIGTLGTVAREYLAADAASGPASAAGEESGTVSRVLGTVRDWISR
ncbi:MAG: amino acid adenylation domain-containing protein [Gemmatimonadota bacterium]